MIKKWLPKLLVFIIFSGFIPLETIFAFFPSTASSEIKSDDSQTNPLVNTLCFGNDYNYLMLVLNENTPHSSTSNSYKSSASFPYNVNRKLELGTFFKPIFSLHKSNFDFVLGLYPFHGFW